MAPEQDYDLANLQKCLLDIDLAPGVGLSHNLHGAERDKWKLKEVYDPKPVAEVVEVWLLNHGKVYQGVQIGHTIKQKILLIGLTRRPRTEDVRNRIPSPF